jgi:hypothetical protein
MPRREGEPKRHGTASSYTNYACRCDACKRAWRRYQRGKGRTAMHKKRAKYLAAGLNGNGVPRKRPYDWKSLELMRRFGVQPDPRWMP